MKTGRERILFTLIDFELNHEHHQNAKILLTSHNFGSGSSREHAPWSLREYGFQVIIAPSFADIFYNNCFKNAILPIVLAEDKVKELFKIVASKKGHELTVDLRSQTISDDEGWTVNFDIDPFKKKSLLEGLDEIGHSLEHEDKIRIYEKRHTSDMKWVLPSETL